MKGIGNKTSTILSQFNNQHQGYCEKLLRDLPRRINMYLFIALVLYYDSRTYCLMVKTVSSIGSDL